MANEITRFGGLIFFLVILSKKKPKGIINYGRFLIISKDQWKR
jgi:hypothetical protein